MVKVEDAAHIVAVNDVHLDCTPQVVVVGSADFFSALVVAADTHPPLMDADPGIELVAAVAPAHSHVME